MLQHTAPRATHCNSLQYTSTLAQTSGQQLLKHVICLVLWVCARKCELLPPPLPALSLTHTHSYTPHAQIISWNVTTLRSLVNKNASMLTDLFKQENPDVVFFQVMLHTATCCNMLQHAATRCNTLQRTVAHCNTRQRTAPHCRQHTATHCSAF